mgnify:CR=1 FL=1
MNKGQQKAQTYIERLGFHDPDLTTPEHDTLVLWAYQHWKELLKDIMATQKIPENTIARKKLECAIYGYNGYILGFWDLVITFYWNEKRMSYDPMDGSECNKSYENSSAFYFEIKPNVRSIGEMMREINFYRQARAYTDYSTYIIITKTKGLKELFKEQDILIIEYPGEDSSHPFISNGTLIQ